MNAKITQIIITLFIIPLNLAAQADKEPELKEMYEGQILVEHFDSTNTDENRYNTNNKIFKVGSSFTYEYQYYSKEGVARNFRYLEEGWEFKDPEEGDINQLILKVFPGLDPFIEWMPDYNQTIIAYQPSNKENFEMTGVIENRANLWMHPPRDGMFRMLELSPFPLVKFPLETGNTWKWSLIIGNSWADERWATWEGQITNETFYEVTGKELMDTKWGEKEIWIIKAEAKSELGSTFFEGKFHTELGFIEMDYTNIDGSRIRFDLQETSL